MSDNVSHDEFQDHRELNHALGIFTTDPLIGSGLPVWLPNGSIVRDELEQLARDIARADGCHGVHSPCSPSASCSSAPATGRSSPTTCSP
ncbi:hypothetical protein [Barrientosiimonas endolithica]|uniref:Uncharacterized protein n=1 Tax=Barrientosiimonas endolithica TaxID=1535208 RepID=A0ABM8HFM5_9MICO|nr:hypothetical protein [Barrientosiimonas endolithica]BDZ59810.1 hypothetical protein GCM10025872_34670 [Barrientosiimonas endolithica]